VPRNPYDDFDSVKKDPNVRRGDRVSERRRIAAQKEWATRRQRGENPFDESEDYKDYSTPTIAQARMQEVTGVHQKEALAYLRGKLGELASGLAGIEAPDATAVADQTAGGKQAVEAGRQQLEYASSETPLTPVARQIVDEVEQIQAGGFGEDEAARLLALRGRGEEIIGQLQGMLSYAEDEVKAIQAGLEEINNEIR
jgi:hypothetical protein